MQPSDTRFEGCGEQVSRKPAKPRTRGGVATGPSNLTVDLLKAFLRRHGLPTSGTKSELLKRAQTIDGSSSINNSGASSSSSNDRARRGKRSDSGDESLEEDDSDVTDGSESDDETGPSGETGYAVHSIDKRRTIRAQIQYQFTWIGEDKTTWETRFSYERWGAVDHERGMTRDQIQERCTAIDAEHRSKRASARSRV